MKTIYKVLLLGFILRLIPFVYVAIAHPEGLLSFDSYGYLNIAENLIEHQTFSKSPAGEPILADISRTPVFPLLLTLLKFFSDNVIWLGGILLLIGSVNVWLTFKIADILIANKRMVLLATILMAIDIPSIFFSSIILTETLFTCLLLLLLLLTIQKDIDLKRSILIGFMMSMVILCRPIAVFLPLLFIIYLIWKQKSWKIVGSFLFSSYLLVTLWAYRNYTHFEMFTVSNISTANFYFHTSASLIAETENLPTYKVQHQLSDELMSAEEWTGDPVKDMKPMIAYANKASYKYITEHPWLFAKQYTIGLIYFFTKPIRNYIDYYLGFTKRYSALAEKKLQSDIFKKVISNTSFTAIILVIFQLVCSLIICLGVLFYVIKSKREKEFLFLLGIILYFAFTSSITEVDGRFRIPMVPLLAILGALGWSKMILSRIE